MIYNITKLYPIKTKRKVKKYITLQYIIQCNSVPESANIGNISDSTSANKYFNQYHIIGKCQFCTPTSAYVLSATTNTILVHSWKVFSAVETPIGRQFPYAPI